MCNRFVKLYFDILEGYPQLSLKSKVLYCILADRIKYSQFSDNDGKYYFMSRTDREDIGKLVDIDSSRSFERCIKELRDGNLLTVKKANRGCKFYMFRDSIPPKMAEHTAKNGGTIPPKMAEPLYNQTNKSDKHNKRNYTNSMNNIDNDYNANADCKDSITDKPTFIQVLRYWKDNHYSSNPADFFSKYDCDDWMINGQPVRSWKKLADFWERCEFVDLPVEFYSTSVLSIMPKIPTQLRERIIKEQIVANGKVRKITADEVNKCIGSKYAHIGLL